MFISEAQRTGRITSGGKITSLTSDFKLKDDKSFSLFLKPGTGSGTSEVLNVTLVGNAAACDHPVIIEEWNPQLMTEITGNAANQAILAAYDIYWGSGEVAEVDA